MGRYKGLLFRSLYEYSYYRHLEARGVDLSDVRQEPFAVPYSIRRKGHLYYPDLLIISERRVVEVKSTREVLRKRGSRILAAKFAAAREFCESYGLSFSVVTEEDFTVLSRRHAEADPDVVWIRRPRRRCQKR